MKRRTLLATGLAAGAAALAAPRIGNAQAAKPLRFVPDADLALLDPVVTTSYQTRDHGFMVWDTLYGQDSDYRVRPQMLAGHTTENDGKTWKLTLREGLKFHDGTPVLARDAAASVARWAKRDSFGQALMARVDEISAPDDRTIQIRLKEPFSLLPDALGHYSPNMCPIMPARLAESDATKPVTEMVGSGPYRYKADERVAGSRVVYEKFAGYVPRDEPADRTAGGKVAHIERVEWAVIPDTSTVAGALINGEIDWWGTPVSDLLPMLKKAKGVVLPVLVPTGLIATMRFNQMQPPFNNPGVRRAIVHAVKQSDYMIAVQGEDASTWREGVGYFCPGTPMASSAGMENLTSPRNLDAVKKELEAAGYKGERVVILGPMDIPSTKAIAEVTADLYKKIGLNVDFQAMDWATVVQRRVKQDPVDQGGWSVFHTSWGGVDQFNPAVHAFLRGSGRDGIMGWPTSARIEELRNEWFHAPDQAAQKKVCEQLQLQAFQDVPYIPLGQALGPTAHRAELKGVQSGLPVFWNITRG
jgi:peptide/nickel transport system substrate-binding protein